MQRGRALARLADATRVQLRDLLNPDNDNLNIRESRDKGTYIEDVTEIVCSTWDEVQKVMQKGENNR
jgi:hypothetical protein